MFSRKFLKVFSYVVLSIVGFIVIVQVGNYIKITNSEAYPLAKSYIITNQDLIDKIGEVKSFDKFPSGNIGYENGKTVAQIETEVTGSKLSGKVIVLMEKKTNNEWEYKKLFFDEHE